jgi:hypothetical protein
MKALNLKREPAGAVRRGEQPRSEERAMPGAGTR